MVSWSFVDKEIPFTLFFLRAMLQGNMAFFDGKYTRKEHKS
jgi:hypothetical protein